MGGRSRFKSVKGTDQEKQHLVAIWEERSKCLKEILGIVKGVDHTHLLRVDHITGEKNMGRKGIIDMIDQGHDPDQDHMRRKGIERGGEVTQMIESIVAKNDKVQLTIQISR